MPFCQTCAELNLGHRHAEVLAPVPQRAPPVEEPHHVGPTVAAERGAERQVASLRARIDALAVGLERKDGAAWLVEGVWRMLGLRSTPPVMRFPIDVVYVSRKNIVVALDEAMAPWRFGRIRRGSRYVVELPAGTIAATGTEVGDTLVR